MRNLEEIPKIRIESLSTTSENSYYYNSFVITQNEDQGRPSDQRYS